MVERRNIRIDQAGAGRWRRRNDFVMKLSRHSRALHYRT
jgi:hypothetical protein